MRALRELRVAVVGLGSIGNRHARNLLRLGIAEPLVIRRGRDCNEAFQPPPTATVLHSLDDALAGRLDAAILCTPTSMHIEQARRCIEAGVPVLVEKPLGADSDAAAELVELAKDRGTLASVAYSLRYHPAYAAAHWAMQAGRIGEVLYAKAWFEDYLPGWHPWEDYRTSYAAQSEVGGGVLPTIDHEIDFFNWCFGPPESVYGQARRTGALDCGAIDHASLLLRYAEGIGANIELSFCRRDRARGFELVGKEGSLRFDWRSPRLELHRGGNAPQEIVWADQRYDTNEMYLEMLADFLTAVASGRRASAPIALAAGLDALRVADAVCDRNPAGLTLYPPG